MIKRCNREPWVVALGSIVNTWQGQTHFRGIFPYESAESAWIQHVIAPKESKKRSNMNFGVHNLHKNDPWHVLKCPLNWLKGFHEPMVWSIGIEQSFPCHLKCEAWFQLSISEPITFNILPYLSNTAKNSIAQTWRHHNHVIPNIS